MTMKEAKGGVGLCGPRAALETRSTRHAGVRTVLASLSSIAAAALALAGCGDDGGSPGLGADGGAGSRAVTLSFRAQVGDAGFGCGERYDSVGASASTLELADLRLFVHDVELLDASGNAVPVELEQDGIWQLERLALLDFEDGTGACQSGTPMTNETVRGSVPEAEYTGVRFVLGVPFEQNHINAATAPSPLNLETMFWNWNGGYKFLRIDGSTAALEGWRFHLGSTGCDGDMQGNVTECTNPNRATVELTDFDLDSDTVIVDVGALLDGVPLDENSPDTPPGCMATPGDPDCAPYFRNLGLAWEGSEPGPMRLFRAE
jgi:uncharacterized repeat protein (TIGR04052 family)